MSDLPASPSGTVCTMIDDTLSAEIKAHLLASFKDAEVIEAFTEHILSKVLGPAIKKELAVRDEKIEALQKQLDEKVSEIDDLNVQIDEIEQYSRKYCINIKGVPETQREDPIEIVMNIADGIGVSLQATDIDVAHRIGRLDRSARGPRTRDLCVKFRSYQKRQEMWQSRKALRSRPQPGGMVTRARTSQGDRVPDIFMYENLTRHRQQVMFVARELKRARKLWAVWSDGGVIKVKKTQASNTVIVKTAADVQKIAEVASSSQPPPASSAGGGSVVERQREATGGAATEASAEAGGAVAAPGTGHGKK